MATNSYISEQSPAGDFDTITVGASSIPLTAAKVQVARTGGFKKNAIMAFLSVETNSIRVRWDGGAPTSSLGHLLAAGDTLTVAGEQNVANLRLIRVSADGTVQVTFYYNS